MKHSIGKIIAIFIVLFNYYNNYCSSTTTTNPITTNGKLITIVNNQGEQSS